MVTGKIRSHPGKRQPISGLFPHRGPTCSTRCVSPPTALFVIVESGGQLFVNGGILSNVDLELKAGSSFRIINGGIVMTKNDFIAPVGVIVDIVQGEIMKYNQ